MNKKILVLAVASVMFGSGAAFAHEDGPMISVNGYGAVDLNITNEADPDSEGQFSVPETEISFETQNLFLAIDASDDSDFSIGQAFFNYQVMDGWTARGGLFDSNLTADEGAATDRGFIEHSLLFDQVDAAGGASLKGVEIAGELGMVTARLAYANDTSIVTGEGKNSVMLLLNTTPNGWTGPGVRSSDPGERCRR